MEFELFSEYTFYIFMKKVFVAMSGGVDSSVAAALLREQGYDVRGIFMQTWQPDGVSCTSGDDRHMAARAAAHLGIPFTVWDFREDYKRAVVDYMMVEYAAGRTPNPDVMCNKQIKFGMFLQRALEQGADFIATGHYVRLRTTIGNKHLAVDMKNKNLGQISNIKSQIFIAVDRNKDQSYFLWMLTQEQLKYCLFPLGEYEKPRVRAMARERGLPNWDKKDSQGLCFVGKVDFADFLRTYLPEEKGVVLTTAGVKIGDHDGAQFVTIGQRHGLGLSSKYQVASSKGNSETKAHYVVERDVATNTVVVAEEHDPMLYRKEIIAANMNWISGNAPRLPLRCLARIRYRQPLQAAHIVSYGTYQAASKKNNSLIHDTSYVLHFDEPQRAVASGQSAVFYAKDGSVLGGGVIA